MFEAHVLHLLQKYLGEYVHGLSAEALRISVWKGDVILRDLKLKAEALNSLRLPVTVKAGFVGTITLKLFKLEDVAMGIWVEQFKRNSQEVQYINDYQFHNDGCESNYVLAHYQRRRTEGVVPLGEAAKRA